MDFVKIIRELISLKQEGPYWDFKREWYSQDKKADLLHDIIAWQTIWKIKMHILLSVWMKKEIIL